MRKYETNCFGLEMMTPRPFWAFFQKEKSASKIIDWKRPLLPPLEILKKIIQFWEDRLPKLKQYNATNYKSFKLHFPSTTNSFYYFMFPDANSGRRQGSSMIISDQGSS